MFPYQTFRMTKTLMSSRTLFLTTVQLFASLEKDQRDVAFQPRPFPEIEQGKPVARPGAPKGLPAEKMNEKQRDLLLRLVQSYADRMPAEVAQAEMAEVKSGGLDKIYFALTNR